MTAIRHPVDGNCIVCYRCDEAGPTDDLIDVGPNGINLTHYADGNCSSVAAQFNTARGTYCPGNGNAGQRCFANHNYENHWVTDVLLVTVSAWVTRKTAPVHAYDSYFVDLQPIIGRVYRDAGSEAAWSYALTLMNDGSPRLWLNLSGAGRVSVAAPGALTVDDETLVTGVWDGTFGILYVNGAEVARSPNYAGQTIVYCLGTTQGWVAAGGNDGWVTMTHAELDDMAIYNVAKTPEWIAGINDLPDNTTPTCLVPLIDTDFTLNHYVCLRRQFTDVPKLNTPTNVPFALAHHAINIREQKSVVSGSLDNSD